MRKSMCTIASVLLTMFFTLALLVVAGVPVRADDINLANPGFETGDFTGWTVVGNAAVVTAGWCGPIHCVNPNEGNYFAVVTAGGVSVDTLDAALGVDLQAAYPGQTLTYGSAIYQDVTVNAGDHLVFAWDYLANDYLPFEDPSFVTAMIPGNGQVILLSNIPAVGDNGTTGWQVFDEVANYTTTYRIGFVAFNGLDNGLSSQLAVDSPGVVGTPEPSTTVLSLAGIVALLVMRKRIGQGLQQAS